MRTTADGLALLKRTLSRSNKPAGKAALRRPESRQYMRRKGGN